jgi:fructokinase
MIATMGEALVDLIEQPDGLFRPCLGGSVCNFTVGLARQGMTVSYLNPLSQDHFGDRFAQLLTGAGVILGAAARSACPTSIAVVNLDALGAPTYAFHRAFVADRDVTASGIGAVLPPALKLLHTGGLALVPDDLARTLAVMANASARGAIVSLDINVRPAVVRELALYLQGVRRAITQAHIVKASNEDLDALGIDCSDLSVLAETLFADSALQLIVITRGAAGAALLTRHWQVELHAPAGLAVVDTVGAGDCFHAGLIAWLQRAGQLDSPAMLERLDRASLQGALRHALAAASINVTRVGCDPATWEETLASQSQPVAPGF